MANCQLGAEICYSRRALCRCVAERDTALKARVGHARAFNWNTSDLSHVPVTVDAAGVPEFCGTTDGRHCVCRQGGQTIG